MSGSIGPTAPIDGLPAAPPRVSLLSSLPPGYVLDSDADGHFANGVQMLPEQAAVTLTTSGDFPYWWVCQEGAGTSPETNSSTGLKKAKTPPALRRYRPWYAYVGEKTTAGDESFDREARVRRALEANLSRIVENELWTGARATLAGFPNDALSTATGLTTMAGGVAVGVITALDELEQGLLDADNGPGIIHAQPRLVSAWLSSCQNVSVSASGRQIVTGLGTLIVPGSGYPGSGVGVAAGSSTSTWAYATGMVRVYRSPVEIRGGTESNEVDRTVDDVTIRAERIVAALWDGQAKVGVKVDLTKQFA